MRAWKTERRGSREETPRSPRRMDVAVIIIEINRNMTTNPNSLKISVDVFN